MNKINSYHNYYYHFMNIYLETVRIKIIIYISAYIFNKAKKDKFLVLSVNTKSCVKIIISGILYLEVFIAVE